MIPRVLLLLLLLAPSTALAGPWTKAFGEHYVKIGADFYATRDYEDARATNDAETAGFESFFGQQYSLYGEIGVFPLWPIQLTAHLPVTVGNVVFFDSALIGEGETGKTATTRLGDLRVAVQTAILRKPFQLGGLFEVKVPLYSNGRVGFGLGPYRQWFALPGDGQIDLTAMIVAGGSFPTKIPLWVEAGVGYRHRTEAFVGWTTDLVFVDGLPFYAAVGLAPGPVWIVVRADGIKNFVADETTREVLTVGPSIGVTVWKGVAIEARFAGDVLVNNAPRGLSFGAGVSWRWPNPATKPKSE